MNPVVNKTLVTTGDQAIVTAGTGLSGLGVGQIGVFSSATNLAIDGSDLTLAREFYLAVGVDTNGGSTVNKIVKSPVFKRRDVTAYNSRCYTPSVDGIYDISLEDCSSCSDVFTLTMDFTAPSEFFNYGFNRQAVSYTVKPECCTGCSGCDNANETCADVVKKLRDEINADPGLAGIVTAYAVAPGKDVSIYAPALTDNQIDNLSVTAQAGFGQINIDDYASIASGAVVTLASTNLTEGVDWDAATSNAATATSLASALDGVSGYSASASGSLVTVVADTADADNNAIVFTIDDASGVYISGSGTLVGGSDAATDQCPTLRVKLSQEAYNSYCKINRLYSYPRNFSVTLVPLDGLECCGTFTERQASVTEEGSGYDIGWQEYHSEAYEGSPFRITESGIPLRGEYRTSTNAGTYDQLFITAENENRTGWGDYTHLVGATIAVPCGGTTTMAELTTVLDLVLSDFDGQNNDTDACGCNLADPTSAKAANLDGIG